MSIPYLRGRYTARLGALGESYGRGFWKQELQNIQRGIPAPSVTVDVRDFGITQGTRPVDSAGAVARALAQTPAYGSLLLPANTTLYIGADCRITNPISIYGDGCTMTAVAGSGVIDILHATDVSDITISGVSFDGTGTALNCVGLYSTAANPSNVLIDRCSFTGTATDDALLYGGVRVFATAGVGSGFEYSDVTIMRSRFTDLGTHGAVIQYATGVDFLNNRVSGVHNHGVEPVGCTDILIAQNRVQSVRFNGIAVGGQSGYLIVVDNRLTDCAQVQDGAISIESTDAYGVVAQNIVRECATVGISVNYSGSAASPNDRVQGIDVCHNTVLSKSGITNPVGINMYSQATTAGFGRTNRISHNTVEGFNIPIAVAYMRNGSIDHNIIRGLTGSGAHPIDCTYVTDYDVAHNVCEDVSPDHAVQFHAEAGVPAHQCDNIAVSGNRLQGAATGKAAVSFTGTGVVAVHDNTLGDDGADAWLTLADNATVGVYSNVGTVGATLAGAGVPVVRSNTNNWAR